MDIATLPEGALAAGKEFYSRLTALGLHPEGALWVFDAQEREFVYWIVWSGVDYVGPFELMKRIFSAIKAAGLPGGIDPFKIEVRSPKELWSAHILAATNGPNVSQAKIVSLDTRETRYEWDAAWAFHLQRKSNPAWKTKKDWRRFDERVTALAA